MKTMRAIALTTFFLLGCSSGAQTSVLVHVKNGETSAPSAITVSVFDGFGLVGRRQIMPATLPGAITISGLGDRVAALRVVATSDGPRTSDAVAVETVPGAQVTELLTLHAATLDRDGDGVPD